MLSALESNSLYRYMNLFYHLIRVRRDEKLSREALERLQRERFESLLRHVFDRSEFYNELYLSHGIKPSDIPDIALSDLPPIDKQMVMDNYDRFVCDKELRRRELEQFIADSGNCGTLYKGRYQVIHTSGSTGHIGIFTYDMSAWNVIKALAITRVSRVRIDPFHETRLAFIGATDGHYAGVSLTSDAPRLLYEFERFSVNRPMNEIIDDIEEFAPDSMCGYSSSIHMLAREQLKGDLHISPKSIICSADPLSPSMRESVKEAFGVDPTNFYASSESLCMAAECEKHEGLHLFEDQHIFEALGRDMKPAGEGNPGTLLITTLYNYAQPLIRYRMQDEIILDKTECGCGRSTVRIAGIAGREEEFLWFTDPEGNEVFLHPSGIVELFVPGLEKFQVEQTGRDHIHMRIITHADTERVISQVEAAMHKIMAEKGLERYVGLSVEAVGEIPLDKKTGKLRLIIPYRENK